MIVYFKHCSRSDTAIKEYARTERILPGESEDPFIVTIPRGINRECVLTVTTQYNKLVRDRIPEIIEASGKQCSTEILSAENYLKMIDEKLDEELREYHESGSLEELADILEVLRAATVARGYTLEELERVREEKAAERGAFQKKILLKEVY